jgi:hypothetical protein
MGFGLVLSVLAYTVAEDVLEVRVRRAGNLRCKHPPP